MNKLKSNERILVVDDEPTVVRLCVRALTSQGYQVHSAGDGREALARLKENRYDLLLLDLIMPDLDGLAVLRRARELDPHVTAIIITGYGTLENAIDALRAGARGFLLKPFTPTDLLPAVTQALREHRQEQENLLLRARLPILEISQTLMTDGGTEPLAERLLEVVVRQIGADRASLMLLDKREEELYIAGAVGLPTEVVDVARVPVGQGIAGRVLLRGEPLVLNDRAGLEPTWQASMAQPEVAAAVCVPVRTREQILGVFNVSRVDKTVARPFTPDEVNLLSIMGSQIATTLDNARLYREIRTARDHSRAVLDSLHDEVLVMDQDYVIVDVNAAFLHASGYRREEVVGQHCYRITHHRNEPCDEPGHQCPMAEVWHTGQSSRVMHVHYDWAGAKMYVDVVASPLYDEEGRIVQVIEAHRDVTTERRLEEKLQAIHALGEELLLARDEVQIAQLVVEAAERMLEFQVCDLWLIDEKTRTLALRFASASEIETVTSPLPLDGEHGIGVAVAKSGEAMYLPDVSQDPRYVPGGLETRSELCVPIKVGGRVIGVLNAESETLDAFDKADQRLFVTLADQAAQALENARLFETVTRGKREWEITFDAIADGIAFVDSDFRIARVNRTLAEWLNTTPQALIGNTCHALLDLSDIPPATCVHREAVQSGQPQSMERTIPGSENVFLVSAYPLYGDARENLGSVLVLKDVTEQKRMQANLIQTEKLTALGRLAASLAHEINNPLQALRSGLRLLTTRRTLEEEKRQRYLEVASREVERLIGIVERMLNFYRPSTEQREPTDVNGVVDDILALAGKRLQHGRVTVRRQLAADLPPVEAVADQLKQVFLNIVINALDAMPGGGELSVETGWDDDHQEVWVAFADTGEGIPPEDIPRIFEPFFTRKLRGTGLGLSISYGIAERHGGRIEVESQVGVGSTFTVFLPRDGLS